MRSSRRFSCAWIALSSASLLVSCGADSDGQAGNGGGAGTTSSGGASGSSSGGTSGTAGAGGGAMTGGTTTGGTATGGTAGSATSGAGGSGPMGGTGGSGAGRGGADGAGQGGRGGSAGSATGGGGGVAGVWDCTDAPPDLCFCNHQAMRSGTDHCSTTYECCFGTATSCECADRATCEFGLGMGAMSVPKCPPDP